MQAFRLQDNLFHDADHVPLIGDLLLLPQSPQPSSQSITSPPADDTSRPSLFAAESSARRQKARVEDSTDAEDAIPQAYGGYPVNPSAVMETDDDAFTADRPQPLPTSSFTAPAPPLAKTTPLLSDGAKESKKRRRSNKRKAAATAPSQPIRLPRAATAARLARPLTYKLASFSASSLPADAGAYTGAKQKGWKEVPWTLEELEEQGFVVHAWDGM